MTQLMTLQPATQAYIQNLPYAGRKTLAPSTQHAYTLAANKNLEYFGASAPLAELRNGTVKKYVDALKAEKLEAVTINRRIFVLDAVIKSVRDVDGECVFKQTLDADYLALPLQEPKQQPCATRAEVENGVDAGCLLVAFLAASGLRISEALALEIRGAGDSYDRSTGTIEVRRTLKTPAAARTVFLPSNFTAWLNSQIPTTGRVFPFTYQQVRDQVARLRLPSPHSFRHFRVTHLRANGVLEDFIRNQAGHSARSTTDRYSHAAGNLEALRAEIERVGVGFKFAE